MKHTILNKTLRLLAFIAALAPAAFVAAQGILIPEPSRDVPVGRLRTAAVTPHRVRVACRVRERAAEVHLDQAFKNPYDTPLEGTFMLALPKGATVSDFAFEMDGKRVKGELLDAQRAREVYQSIVQRLKDPALLEWADRQVLRLSLFPIAPHGEARVEVMYSQLLPADAGLVELTLPLRTPAAGEAPEADVAAAVTLTLERALGPVYSPSHKVEVTRPSAREARLGFESSHHKLDRDLLVLFAPAERGVGTEVLSYRTGSEDGFFLLLVAPEAASTERPAKDVVFVLDTSGSMRDGDKMKKAVAALSFGVKGLGSEDRFDIVSFATEARPWREHLVNASPENVAAAVKHLENLDATGGTAIHEALAAGLKLCASDGDRPRYLVFLTDGLPTVGVTSEEEILKLARAGKSECRVFTFGVGYDVNAPLLDQLAEAGRGRSQFVKPEEDLEVKVSSFFAKLNRPALVDLKLSIDGVRTHDLLPRELPDLFDGDELVVAGRYEGSGTARVSVAGSLRGVPWTTSRSARLPERDEDVPALAVIWAERRVGNLLAEIRLHGESAELRDEVVRLARTHGLVTPYTSYLVAESEPMAPAAEARQRLQSFGYGSGSGGPARTPQTVAPGIAAKAFDAPAGTRDSLATSEALAQLKDKQEAARSLGVRVVDARRFRLDQGVWVDDAYRAGMKQTRIEAYSQAYFALITAHPELSRVFALGQRVVVVMGATVYRIEPAN